MSLNNLEPIEIYDKESGGSDIFLISKRDINVGEELTYDYGPYFDRVWRRKTAQTCLQKLSGLKSTVSQRIPTGCASTTKLDLPSRLSR